VIKHRLSIRLHAQGREINKIILLLLLLPLEAGGLWPCGAPNGRRNTRKLYSYNPKGRKASPAAQRRMILKCI
jgi:hypothetical protein